MTHKVLIIEDSETMVQLYKGLLDQFNCKIDVATNSEEAKDLVTASDYDVYIIDIMIPGPHEGVDFIGKGGASPDRCIILSGNLPEDKVLELMDYHHIDRQMIMVKPPDTHKFVELVKEIIFREAIEDDHDKKRMDEIEELSALEGALKLADELDRRKPGKGRRESDHVVNLDAVSTLLSNLTGKQWCAILTFIILIPTFLTTYSTFKGYKEHQNYNIELDHYAEKRFEYFKIGTKITKKTYIEHVFEHGETEYILEAYPDDFIRLIVTSDEHEPVEHWIAGPKYMEDKGIGKDKSFWEIVRETWLGPKK